MNEYDDKLVDFIKQNSINAEHLVFQTSCHSVEEAAASANTSVDNFVKNVCIINETNNELIVCIVPGTKRLDIKKLALLIGTKKLRFATTEEILSKTGYPMGGTPSFGYSARFFIDNEVLTKEIVYSGGGSQNSLTKISPLEMICPFGHHSLKAVVSLGPKGKVV
ncbi:MAG: YbaK/EbsC family protein [Candidatus Micrarchaeota archaeon]|nr:YbaK/EbsC family protein [Candidatus Micrarchaeota archaeon]